MKMVVLEGLDGAGGETQVRLLKNHLEKGGIPTLQLKSPDYSSPVGKAIMSYLNEELTLDTLSAFLLFSVDCIRMVDKAKKAGKFTILDRYITSTIVYQAARGLNFDKAIKIAEVMGFPEADAIILLDITPATSMKRKKAEKGVLDLHEKDLNYLKKVRGFYLKEAERNVLGKWHIIDGEKSIDSVHEEIIKIVQKL